MLARLSLLPSTVFLSPLAKRSKSYKFGLVGLVGLFFQFLPPHTYTLVLHAQSPAAQPPPPSAESTPPPPTPNDLPNTTTIPSVEEIAPLTEQQISPSVSYTRPPAYVFEVEIGVNAFGYSLDQTRRRYGLSAITDTTAFSYNLKTGVAYLDHWKTLLIFGYTKRANFEYPNHYIRSNESLLEDYRFYRLGIEQQYLIWSYNSRFNLAVGLENSWARRHTRLTARTNIGLPAQGLARPITLNVDEYLLSPKLKFAYRISPYSALHFSFEYHVLFPSIEHYPQFLLGFDVSFFLTKPTRARNALNFNGEPTLPSELQDPEPLPPAESPSAESPSAESPPAESPPAESPPAESPPAPPATSAPPKP